MRTMRLLAAALAALFPLVLMPAAEAARRPPTIVIGDSITVMGKPLLQAAHPRWVVEGVNGRKVERLPIRIEANLAQYRAPRNIVYALGQNESPGWTRRDYRRAVRMVPATTEVFFVTTYRDPAVFGEERAATQAMYSRWMRSLASRFEHVHLIDWRSAVLDAKAVLTDGSHPDEASRQVWADLVSTSVAAAP